MVALVTGGHGFIGRRVSARLLGRGWRVHAAGRPETEIPSVSFSRLVERARPDLVVHCAGPASVPDAEESPDADRTASLDVFRSVLETVDGGTRVVFVSSAAVYGNPNELPVPESAPLLPISAYGRHRVACEELLRDSGLPFVIARVFSAYGEGLRRQVLWDIARKALAGGVVELLGTGDESRDFVHVEDVGEAIAAIASETALEDAAVNVGSGEETTIRQLAELLVSELATGAVLRFTGCRREADPLRWRADVSALSRLGWRPQVGIDEGVRRYAAWVRAAA